MSTELGYEIKGTKLVEIPYLDTHLNEQTSNDNVLIVGERIATEGILQTVLKREFESCVCTDIMEMGKDSTLDRIIKSDSRVSFIQEDFIKFSEDKKFDYIICINVLEHFGMNFAEFHGFSGELATDDYVRWNHDLRALQKMIKLLNKNPKSKIIVTVPAGQPMMSGDINENNKMPFLRRYDIVRIRHIHKMLNTLNVTLEETFYYSENFNEWYETDISITDLQYHQAHNPYTPNAIWAFVIKSS